MLGSSMAEGMGLLEGVAAADQACKTSFILQSRQVQQFVKQLVDLH